MSPCIVVRSTQYAHPRRVFLLAILVVLCTDGQHRDDGDGDVDNGRWVTSLQAGEEKRPVDFGGKIKINCFQSVRAAHRSSKVSHQRQEIIDIISKIYTVESEQWCRQILCMSDSLSTI